MDAVEIITTGVQLVAITEQAVTALGTVAPELMAVWSQWETIGEKFAGGQDITEDEVAALRASLLQLSLSNAADEDKILGEGDTTDAVASTAAISTTA